MSAITKVTMDGTKVTAHYADGTSVTSDSADSNHVGMTTQEAYDTFEYLDEVLEKAPLPMPYSILNKLDFFDDFFQSLVPVVYLWKNRTEFEERRLAYYETVKPEVNTNFQDAKVFVQRSDPLALDLDGDGIETVSANAGITFDSDGDGLKTGTGWVKGDDGFLVLDRNSNGTIDTGKELFGVDTVKVNGQLATDGFDALRDLDGNADGVFDAQDEQFANVRVWQDKNQDGIAQANELKSLAEHNITAINLGSTATSQNSNGNLISAVGTFVRGDGSEGSVNGNQSLAANLDLASNPFYREHTDSIALSDSVKALPGMQGSGAVRDLQEAAMQDDGLRAALSQYSQATTRAEQYSQLDNLLAEWASSSNFRTFDQQVSNLNFTRGLQEIEFEFSYSWEKPENAFTFAAGSHSGGGSGSGTIGGIGEYEDTGPTPEQLAKKAQLEKIKILEIFNGQSFFNFAKEETQNSDGSSAVSVAFMSGSTTRRSSGATGSIPTGTRTIYITEEDLTVNAGQSALLDSAYQALRESVYNGLLLQTRLKPYVNSIELTASEAGIQLDYSGLVQSLVDTGVADPVKAIIDSSDLRQAMPYGPDYSVLGVLTEGWLGQLSDSQLQSLSQQLNGLVLQNGDASGALTGGTGVDFLMGQSGNDTLTAGTGDDFLSGGEGNDNLRGGNGNDLLLGGEGNDTLSGDAGDDILDGGAGNDNLNGNAGSDIYRFSRGWGQDTVSNYDTSVGKVDAIVFADDIAPDDIVVTRSSINLILS
ncbi:calcium-binding protein, partial [Pseudomonas sp. 8BK]|uniref:calcium-binding protein n=1 Tax=Pseudomonas sp. 8BK TaxID=2653164 RepID=UPI001358BDBC